MIKKFGNNTAFLIIDAQNGINDTKYYGGVNGRRNNPNAEKNIISLLESWRERKRPVAFTQHDSRETESPLKLTIGSGEHLPNIKPADNDIVIKKDVNSGFIGTSLELDLRRLKVQRLLIAGFFTNCCIETTVRMAGNMGFDTYLIHDACAAMNRIGHDGTDYDADLVHNMAIANLHGEFCTAISTNDALNLFEYDAVHLKRVQGNE